jgi:hypothetical protein
MYIRPAWPKMLKWMLPWPTEDVCLHSSVRVCVCTHSSISTAMLDDWGACQQASEHPLPIRPFICLHLRGS